jgi:hypothetical protein
MPDNQRASFDLHLHSHWSYDATATVDELFAAAEAANVGTIAITDHHVIDGIADVIAASAQYPDITVVSAAELTVTASIGSVDMVCLGFTPAAIEALAPVWDRYHEWQREYAEALCAGVRALGFDYTDAHRKDLLASYRPHCTLEVQGATHVANSVQRAWFIERGFIESAEDYGQFLTAAQEKVPRPPYPGASVILPAVKREGALVSIAHPTGYFNRDNRERMDHLREELLLDGVECAHRSVPAELTPVYRAWCEEHGLLSTGGSDVHQPEDLGGRIGAHIGPDEWWVEIKARLPEGSILAG